MSIIRQRQKKLIIAFLMGFLLSLLSFVLFMSMTQWDIYDLITQRVDEKEEVIKIEYYVAYQPIEAGQLIDRGDLALMSYEMTSAPHYIPMPIEQILGQRARIAIPAQMPIAQSFISKEVGLKGDERVVQCEDVKLARDVEAGQYVDVRIAFPTGLNYTILARKKIERVERDETQQLSPIWLMLDEEEQMKLASAYVDKSFYEGTYIYTTRYVDEVLQTASSSNYPVNLSVLSLIRLKNSDISQDEIETLTKLRQGLDDSLVLFAREETLGTTSEIFGVVPVQEVKTEATEVIEATEATEATSEKVEEPVVSGF